MRESLAKRVSRRGCLSAVNGDLQWPRERTGIDVRSGLVPRRLPQAIALGGPRSGPNGMFVGSKVAQEMKACQSTSVLGQATLDRHW